MHAWAKAVLSEVSDALKIQGILVTRPGNKAKDFGNQTWEQG